MRTRYQVIHMNFSEEFPDPARSESKIIAVDWLSDPGYVWITYIIAS